jgi:Abnormal spindle-like microcephaly-assoc'd, ASPM-SPD-2-Hydin
MGDERKSGSSFWTSVPGVLTGVAAIITAVGALLGTLAATGVIHFGQAARASLETSASIQSFGSVQVGQGSPASVVTVSNRGKAGTTVATTLEGAGAGDFAIALSTCANVSLPANTSCQLQLTFGPRSQGDKASTLRITADNADVPPPLLFTGTGRGVALVSFDPTTVPFSLTALPGRTPPTSATRPLTIMNPGTGDLTIISVRSDDSGAHFAVTSGCDHRVLAPGQSCQVSVTFTATTNGQFSAHALVFDDLGPGPQSVPLSGYRGPLVIVLPSKPAQA